MNFCLLSRALGRVVAVGALGLAAAAQADIVPFTMLDVGIFPGAPPASVVATTGQQIPGGVDNTSAGNEFNISYIQFDIDDDGANDLQFRTATFAGGQIVFDGLFHTEPAQAGNGSFIITNLDNSYLNRPFTAGEIIGDGLEEFVRDRFGGPGPPENNTFSVAVDEGGTVRFYDDFIEGFVGFKLKGGLHGWIRTAYEAAAGGGAGALTLLDGAYDDTGAPIAAGSLEPLPADADFDGDGDVDGLDFLAWQGGFGLDGIAATTDGDANQDFFVNGVDFSIWKSQFGETTAVAAAGAVPEPAAALLAACGAALLAVAARARRRPETIH
jgi:hypothetical protein